MGLWPFGGGKKRLSSHGEDPGHHTLLEKGQTHPVTALTSSASQEFDSMGRSQNRRGQPEKSRKLPKQRLPSQTGNAPRSVTLPINVPEPGAWEHRRAPAVVPGILRGSDIYSHNPMSQSSIGPEEFTALPQTPTLLAKRQGYDPTLQKRKSSKRKAEDNAREREVRAMSSPVLGLKRPITYSGPLRRDTKQVPGNLNLRLHRPASEVSLPLPGSIQESHDMTNQASFKIGIFAALSPRPTLTYVANPRPSAGKQPAKLKPSIEKAIEEEDVTSKKRIDDLADELDAGGLRELMDRDRRRHERKKVVERDRLQRKLQRKADRQREEEIRGRQPNDASDNTVALGLDQPRSHGRRQIGDGTGASETTVAQRIPPYGKEKNPFANPGSSQARPIQQIRNPFDDEKDVDLMQGPFAHENDEGPPVPIRSLFRTISPVEVTKEQKSSQATAISPPTSPIQRPTDRQSFSQTSGLAREFTPDIPEHGSPNRRASDQSSQQLNSWTSFFKRGGRRKGNGADRGRVTPSEFSNTSRESFPRKQQPPPVVMPRTFRKSDSSGVPQRTMSKFREDLPEFPISPPDSRVQSPEAMSGPQAILGQQPGRQPRQSHSGTWDGRSLATSSSNAGLDRGTVDSRHAGAVDTDVGGGALSGMALSQSLASVDSEGSWLSGKPVKRLSSGTNLPLRQSQSSIPTPSGGFEAEEDDLAIDEYLNRLTPGPRRDSITSGRRASSTVIGLERERQQGPVAEVPPVPTDGAVDETWHEGIGRQATVVRQPNRARSKEGLLKEFGTESAEGSRRSSLDGDEDRDGETPEGESHGAELQEAPLLRARSVDYKGGHARHISAGSARLLDIRRSSTHSDAATRPPNTTQLPPSVRQEPKSSSNVEE